MASTRTGRPAGCPPWCILGHGVHLGEEDQIHVSAHLCVRNTLIRLCSSTDPETGAQDGPYVMMGASEYTLDEVDALVEALTSLTATVKAQLIPAQQPESALPVADA